VACEALRCYAGVAGFHAGPLTTSGTKAQLGNPLKVQVYNGADDPGITQDMRTSFTVGPLTPEHQLFTNVR